MMAGHGMLAFVTRDGLGSGPNLSCTVLYLGLLHMIAQGWPIGEKFNILLDNTSGDNKNNDVIFFLAWLVATGAMTEASFFCMMKGHTYSRIDQSFRTLIWHLLQTACWTVTQLVVCIANYLTAYNCLGCVELHHLWDWKAFFLPHVHERFGGFATGQHGSGMHEFVLRKDRHGDVRLHLRQSSQASSWLPEGEGYRVFKSIPTGHPCIAKAKEDSKWGKAVILATVRAWYKYMSVEARQLEGIKNDWETRFNTLPPPCGDLSQLPPAMKLVWANLPQCSPQRGALTGGGNTSDAMENPPINPVTGAGRSAADVARELRAYKADVRKDASNAVFQADYLFVERLPGLTLALHRVVHNACMHTRRCDGRHLLHHGRVRAPCTAWHPRFLGLLYYEA